MPELLLPGCTPEPLMNYLKALGVLRLVSEQADPEARGCWCDDVFALQSKMGREALIEFFLNRYEPTPIVGPWAGGSGFFAKDNKKAVDALNKSAVKRLEPYRGVIALVRQLLDRAKIKDKPAKDQKAELVRRYRAELPDAVVQWMDAALILHGDRQGFAPLLGTGGNDGRLDFSQNFMARLTELGLHEADPAPRSRLWLDNALFSAEIAGLAAASVGQFAPGLAGGPNSTQGMEGDATDNPWGFVLMIEGALILGGAAVRRFAAGADSRAAFPFTVRPSPVGYASESGGDLASVRGELWLPLWEHPARLSELRALFGEGRAQVAARPARDSVDFARAVAGLGVDRGIGQFVRLSFLKRSGKAYLAAPVGRLVVRGRRSVDLLQELDPWLDRFRIACVDEKSPPRFKTAIRGIDQAIFDFCRYGGPKFFQAILVALGTAEREMAAGGSFVTKHGLRPICGLTHDWIQAGSDGTLEFEAALGIAGIFDLQGRAGPLRVNLEPVSVWQGKNGSLAAKWAEKDRAVVWNSASLRVNLAQVLARRIMDGEKLGCEELPLASRNIVSLSTLSRFLAGELDDAQIEDLLWGLMLVEQKRVVAAGPVGNIDVPPLPRAYALLKLLFLPKPLQANDESVFIKPEPKIISLLRAGGVGEACQIAMCRLRASGLVPLPYPPNGGTVRDADWAELDRVETDGHRLAAALLMPLSRKSVDELCRLVLRKAEPERQTVAQGG